MPIIIAMDLETTGLLNEHTDDPLQQPGITEIGCSRWDTETLTTTVFSMLINPEKPIEEKATAITGITDEKVKDAPNLREAFLSMTDFFNGAHILLTYNGDFFDIPLLNFNLQRYGLATRFPWPSRQMDLMIIGGDYMFMKSRSGNKFPKLIELYQHLFQEDFPDQHRAIHDAQATMDCALYLVTKGVINFDISISKD
jgi:DNA polymerase III epsilon subunit-like protein